MFEQGKIVSLSADQRSLREGLMPGGSSGCSLLTTMLSTPWLSENAAISIGVGTYSGFM